MIEQKNRLSFSYSGLKTHVANILSDKSLALNRGEFNMEDICASFQEEALSQIVRKIEFAFSRFEGTKSILVAGGVAANQRFRAMMKDKFSVPSYFPELKYCSDNAAMIAALGHHLYRLSDQSSNRYWDAYSRYDFKFS